MAKTTKKYRTWKEVRPSLSPEDEAEIAAEVAAMRASMPLAELRQARQFTQETLAEAMGVDRQASISRLEHQTDMYVSTLRRYIEAMGGELNIVARFPEGEVRITQFQET